MKAQLVSFILCVTLTNTAIFSLKSGCGTFLAIPLTLGWYAVDSVLGSLFADRHPHVVAAVAAFLSACFLAAFLILVAWLGKKRGLLSSKSSVQKLFIIGATIFVALGLLPIPIGPCF
jgi:hypothetical protein